MAIRFHRVVGRLVLPLLVLIGLPLHAAAAGAARAGARPATTTLTWTGKNSCSWTDQDNWTPAQTPESGDSVILNGSTPNPHICSVPSVDLDQMTIQNGVSLTGAAGTTLSANNVAWTSGSLGVSLVVDQSLLMPDSSGHYEVDGVTSGPQVTLTNNGSTTMIGGATLDLMAGALVVNNGAWSVAPGLTPATIVSSICCVTLSTFENSGIVGGGVNGLTLRNMGYVGDLTGVVDDGLTVDYGISTLKDGTTLAGGATLDFLDSADVNASGTINVSAGATFHQEGGAILDGKTVTFTGDGSGPSSGIYEWSGGTISASPVFSSGVNLLVDGGATKVLEGTGSKAHGALTLNTAAVQQDSGTLNLDGAHATVVNDGIWSVSAPEHVKITGASCCKPASTWQNKGTLEIDSGAIFDLTNAKFDETTGGLITGGGTLDLGYGPQLFEPGASVVGGTTLVLDRNGSFTGQGAVNLLANSVLDLDGNATLLGKIVLAGSGRFYWSRGGIGGTVDVKPGVQTHVVDLAPDASHGRSIASAGKKPATLTVEGGAVQDSPTPISLGSGIKVDNAKGSTWTVADGGMSGSVCCTNPANVGNDGTLDVEAGGVGDAAVFTYLQFTNRGTFKVGGGTTTFNALSPEQVKGTTIVDGNLTTSLPYVLEGGKLQGAGTVTGDLTNDMATVSPGDGVGTLTVTGDFNESPDAAVVADLKDAASDQLIVQGSASLGGTLQLSLDQPGALSRTTRVLIQAGSRTGKFSTVTGLDTLGSPWQITYSGALVRLVPQ